MTLAHDNDAVHALVDSLWLDPFYAAISRSLAGDASRRRDALARYFDYSMSEAARSGHLMVSAAPAAGAAIWNLPLDAAAADLESASKVAYITEAMGAAAADTWRRIVDFMEPRAAAVVAPRAWYLSIVGVAPAAQGRGIGGSLLAPTLALADAAGVDCYLETFDERNPHFYHRLGFRTAGMHLEPVTGCRYAIMIRRAGYA